MFTRRRKPRKSSRTFSRLRSSDESAVNGKNSTWPPKFTPVPVKKEISLATCAMEGQRASVRNSVFRITAAYGRRSALMANVCAATGRGRVAGSVAGSSNDRLA